MKKAPGRGWVGAGSGLGRGWVGAGSGLGRGWVGAGIFLYKGIEQMYFLGTLSLQNGNAFLLPFCNNFFRYLLHLQQTFYPMCVILYAEIRKTPYPKHYLNSAKARKRRIV